MFSFIDNRDVVQPHFILFLICGCRDPNHTVLGFAWGASDEKKMQRTFRLGQQELFGNLLDLQSVVQDLGYQQIGLTKLTEMVLGCPNHKSKKVMHATSLLPPRPASN